MKLILKKAMALLLFVVMLGGVAPIAGLLCFNTNAQDADKKIFANKRVLLIENDLPWGFNSNSVVLSSLDADFRKITTEDFNADLLSDFGVVVFANDQTTETYAAYYSFINQLEEFAKEGGVVLFGAADHGSGHEGVLSDELPGGVIKYHDPSNNNYISSAEHPIVTGVLTDSQRIRDEDLYSNYCSHSCFDEESLPVGSNVILRASKNDAPTLVEYPFGDGLIIASGLTWEWGYDSSKSGEYAKKAMDDYFAYAIQYYNKMITFTVDNVGIKADFKYNDTFFSPSSYIYNHELAKTSLGLATAAMVSDGSDYVNKKPAADEDFFLNLGFDMYFRTGYDKKPTANSIAYVIAAKNVDALQSSVLAVAIRGGGYEGEWSGNFNVGSDKQHLGFGLARNQVISGIIDFLNENKEKIKYKDNMKLWITGYSRSAAVANLVAGSFDDLAQNDNTLDNGEACYSLSPYKFTPNNIFAYLFETPRNTQSANAKSDLYDNIFNIVNRADPVPRVAPSAWSYVRYGKDCYLPSKETMSGSLYNSLYKRMCINFKTITKGKKEYTGDCPFFEISFEVVSRGLNLMVVPKAKINKSMSQGVFLDNMISYLANTIIRSQSNYVKKYQSAVMKLVYTFTGNPLADKVERNLFIELLNYCSDHITLSYILDPAGIDEVLANGIYAIGSPAGITYEDSRSLANQLSGIIIDMAAHPNYLLTILKNGGNLFVPHYTETTLAWMLALDGDYEEKNVALSKILTGNETYRVATINCPVNIKVFDSNGVLCGSISENEVDEIENSITVYIDDDGQKCFCLPSDESFSFEIVGTDEGAMSLSFANYNFELGKKENICNYYDIPVLNGRKYLVTMSEFESNSIEDDVAVWDDNSNRIDASNVIRAPENANCNITVATESSMSSVIGGGQYIEGEYAQVLATPSESEIFVGWFENRKLISNEHIYRFRVEKDLDLNAIFVPKELSIDIQSKKTFRAAELLDIGEGYAFSYKSNNAKIASVDEQGNITGHRRGSTDIIQTIINPDGSYIEIKITVNIKYTWWQWLIVILLFGWIWY